MKSYGLKTEEVQLIKELLGKYFGDISDVKVVIFGSRAKDTHKPYSDIDLAIQTKEKDISKRISLFKEGWENSKLPYKVDITYWKELYKPYLPEIRKTKQDFWKPEDKEVHPWRACPYGKHWVVRHDRLPVKRQLQDVDGHCRKNPSGKDRLDGEEISYLTFLTEFQTAEPIPKAYPGKDEIPSANSFDQLIAGWCRYWNDVLKPDIPLDPSFVKALMESESTFDPRAFAKNKKAIGPARGLIQITEQTWRILKDRKGELKDHYVDIKKEELFDPSKNICAAIRWLFRKREILQKRLSRSPTWLETIVEYKGLGPDLKKNGKESLKVKNKFNEIYRKYQ
jgi:predicted nucleotidyltransferase